MDEEILLNNVWVVKKDQGIIVLMRNDDDEDYVIIMQEEEEKEHVCKLSTITEEELPFEIPSNLSEEDVFVGKRFNKSMHVPFS